MPRTKKEGGSGNRRRRRGHGRSRNPAAAGRPVPLYKRSSSHFQAADRDRGRKYFHEDRVILEIDGTRARAQVRGTAPQPYAVGLDWSQVATRRALHVFCECQRFADGKPCKHLWATLLALADSVGPENHPPGKDRVGLRKDHPSVWHDLGIPVPAGPPPSPPSPARPKARSPGPRRRSAASAEAAANAWRSQLATLRQEAERVSKTGAAAVAPRRGDRGIHLLINTSASTANDLVLDVFEARSGAGNRFQRTSLEPEELEGLLQDATSWNGSGDGVAVVTALPPEPTVRRTQGRSRRVPKNGQSGVRRLRLPPRLYDSVLPQLCTEEALGWWDGRSRSNMHTISFDEGPPWQLALRLEVTAGTARLRGGLERRGESIPLTTPLLILPWSPSPAPDAGEGEAGAEGTATERSAAPAFVLFEETIARLEGVRRPDLHWVGILRDMGEIVIPKDDLAEALTALFEIPRLPPIETPEELELTEERSPLVPRLVLEAAPAAAVVTTTSLLAKLFFLYGNVQASAEDPRPAIIDWEKRSFLRRDMDGEHNALVRLLEAGVRPVTYSQGHELELDSAELPSVAEPLLADGWEVEVRGTSLRAPKPPSLRVESGIDWFELRGSTEFAGDQIELKAILEAVRRGDRFIPLSDGSQGLLPAAWSETYGSLAQLAQDSSEGGLRFLPSQALLVDALLSTMPPADVDRVFAALRKKLQSFDRIKPKKEPRGFGGTLREYQRDGLGWLNFLREFKLGGILADDMGLGKTVQVLALLRSHRVPSKTTGLPSLVVAPRSLVYNWIDEAARFTPTLSVVEYRGPDREDLRERFNEFDIVVTTYATLRRDIDFLATVEFDTVVVDEAQAIKNRDSQSAKASRLLNARNRLALTGTPIENHLGELGSIFEYLNPGLLGSLPRLDALTTGRQASREELAVIAEGIRPFILRRTKAQVLQDLPPKTEQALFCTLNPEQRELYDKLKAGYQASLLGEVETKGSAGSTMQVLEALLRLRQIACHPGLVKAEWEETGSAKLEALFEQVSEVLDEGHKILVFSQFTKLLGFVRRHLDEQEIQYAYLDGKTKDRGAVVEQFQTDPDCNLFLISLKAGGVGLNLTAAEYVFLLDPWWNPAVEAQAIDRAHRIGQTQPVFSYRLIARDTVEEKIIKLQQSKRQLADAILDGDGSPIRDLTAEDLRMLLS